MELTAKEAKSLINRIGPRLGYDYTHEPEFPEGRNDVCAVVHTTENGSTYGYDTVYLVWKEPDGTVKHEEIRNSRSTKDYIHIKSVKVKKDGSISVEFGSGGSYSGVPWSESMKVAIKGGKAETSKEDPQTFTDKVNQKMVEIVESHKHNHPLYKPTMIKESAIDEKRKIAAFVLFEQIDTDRCSEHGDGWLGDQFRYSLWIMRGNKKPVQLFEDHAYIRPRSKSELTGTQGRDCSLKNLRFEGEKIKVSHPKGEKVEDQTWEDLTFSL
ncbi:MAG: hypothetical protein V1877_00895 [Candidatus Tagabacteria bacterium]